MQQKRKSRRISKMKIKMKQRQNQMEMMQRDMKNIEVITKCKTHSSRKPNNNDQKSNVKDEIRCKKSY